MANGKVKWYNETKGFGFIASEDGKDIFVHRTGIDRSISALQEGQSVSFETAQGQKGLMAVNVKAV